MRTKGVMMIVVVLGMMGIFYLGGYYAKMQKNEHVLNGYIDALSMEIDDLIGLLNRAQQWNDELEQPNLLRNSYLLFLMSLLNIYHLSYQTAFNLNDDSDARYLEEFGSVFKSLTYVIEEGRSSTDEPNLNGFREDGVLSEFEINALIALKDELIEIQRRLMNEEKREAYHLSLKELGEIFSQISNRYGYRISELGWKN